jgi:propanediol dehydratase large subunit
VTFTICDIIRALKGDGFPDYEIFRILLDRGFNAPICDIAQGFVQELDYDPVMMSNLIGVVTGRWDGVILVLNRVFAMDSAQIYDWLVDAWSIDPHIVLEGIRKAAID